MAHPTLQAIILAAGKSSRFKTAQSKLTFTLCGQALIAYPVHLLASAQIPTTLVVGHQKEEVITALGNYQKTIAIIEQKEQRGTGHAVACTRESWQSSEILVMNGDMPLVQPETISQLVEQHRRRGAAVSFVTAHHPDPSSGAYGRVITENGSVKIVEARDFTGDVTQNCCINAGIYLFDRIFLEKELTRLEPATTSNELYLTDLIGAASKQGLVVTTLEAPFDSVRGINTLKELWTAEHIKRSELIEKFMEQGVSFAAPHTVHIDHDVTIGANTNIGAGVHLTKGAKIGTGCSIGAFSHIEQSVIADYVTIKSHTIVMQSVIGMHSTVGPFAHLRNQTTIGTQSVIGNFVELSKSSVAQQTKIKHLSYIGNAQVGSHVNVGAGTIVCNYDGFTKHQTVIKDQASIGSLNSLVAPVTIHERALTAAGSTITEDVPADALAIARARQTNKEGYAAYRRTIKTTAPQVASGEPSAT